MLRGIQHIGIAASANGGPSFTGYSSKYNTANTETGSSASDSLRIPLVGTGLTIDWGDGNTDTGVTSSAASPASHNYSASGIYTVNVSGSLTQVNYSNTAARDKLKLIDISQWGNAAWTSFSVAFHGCSNLVGSFTDAPDLSNVTNMVAIFSNTSSFNQPINTWDVSNVTDMFAMFQFASSFNQSVNTWDVGNVTRMDNMFRSVTLSTANYDAILIGWEATLEAAYPSGTGYTPTISIDFGNSEYTGGGAAATARASLISTFGWTISDGGIA
jgi:surface protein